MGEISCPVLLLAGADSESHPREFVERQTEQFPSARMTIVPAATHFLPMERPEAVAGAVRAVLEEIRTAGAAS